MRGPPSSSGREPASVPGRGPSGPWPRTVRASTESTANSSQRSDWRPDRRQHTFWRLRWGHRVHTYQIGPQWSVQKIALTFPPVTL
jgi:hypothetical protein